MVNSIKRLILVELNEVNFNIVQCYVDRNPIKFNNLAKLLSSEKRRTYSEYDYNNLEPWIQWASVHTCKTYEDHKIFRLGDVVNSQCEQIFEKIEKAVKLDFIIREQVSLIRERLYA